jgi:hypothetical protein
MASDPSKEPVGLNMSLDQLIEKNSSQKPERGRGRGNFSGRRNDFNTNDLPGRGQSLRVSLDFKHRGPIRGCETIMALLRKCLLLDQALL